MVRESDSETNGVFIQLWNTHLTANPATLYQSQEIANLVPFAHATKLANNNRKHILQGGKPKRTLFSLPFLCLLARDKPASSTVTEMTTTAVDLLVGFGTAETMSFVSGARAP